MKNRSLIITGILAVLILVLTIIMINANHSEQKVVKQAAYEVLLNNKIWFYVNDQAKFEAVLEDYKNQYADLVDKKAQIKSVRLKQRVEIRKAENYGGKICSLEESRKKIKEKTQVSVQIEVKDGDNIWSIARAQNLSVAELQNLNPQLDKEMQIYPGDQLQIQAEKPVLDVIIMYENTVTEEIPFKSETISDSTLYESQREVIAAGVNGKQTVTYEIVLENNLEVQRKALAAKVITAPVDSKIRVGSKKAVSRSGGNFGVVSGSRISSLFGTRIHPITGEEIFHKGIDIAASQGSPVYAYANGTIIYAGWKSGYGNFIAIDHGNGMVSRYGHLSAIYVSVGQQVAVRQRIGAVGSTGVSTGPHLHFEVLINGAFKNPQNYL